MFIFLQINHKLNIQKFIYFVSIDLQIILNFFFQNIKTVTVNRLAERADLTWRRAGGLKTLARKFRSFFKSDCQDCCKHSIQFQIVKQLETERTTTYSFSLLETCLFLSA